MGKMPKDSDSTTRRWRAQTAMVRGGLARSGFDETSEALYLTSGYVYESAEEAEAAFTGEKKRYQYSRYAHPTVAMFEERLRLLEGAAVCMSPATGMGADFASLMAPLNSGARVTASPAPFGPCLHHVADPPTRFCIETPLTDRPPP